jgi:hypothetical protein
VRANDLGVDELSWIRRSRSKLDPAARELDICNRNISDRNLEAGRFRHAVAFRRHPLTMASVWDGRFRRHPRLTMFGDRGSWPTIAASPARSSVQDHLATGQRVRRPPNCRRRTVAQFHRRAEVRRRQETRPLPGSRSAYPRASRSAAQGCFDHKVRRRQGCRRVREEAER